MKPIGLALATTIFLAGAAASAADSPLSRTWTRVRSFFHLHRDASPAGGDDGRAAGSHLTLEDALRDMVATAAMPSDAKLLREKGDELVATTGVDDSMPSRVMALACGLCELAPENHERNRRVLRAAFDTLRAALGEEAELGLTLHATRTIWLKNHPLHRFDEAEAEAALLGAVAGAVEADSGPGVAMRALGRAAAISRVMMGHRNMVHVLDRLLATAAEVETAPSRRAIVDGLARRSVQAIQDKSVEDADFAISVARALQTLPAEPTWRDHAELSSRLASLAYLPDRKAFDVLDKAVDSLLEMELPAEGRVLCEAARDELARWNRFEATRARAAGLRFLEKLLASD